MTLTISDGPLSAHPPQAVNYQLSGPAHKLLFHPFPRRVRAVFQDEVVADSTNAMLLDETALLPQLYFPEADVRADLLEPSAHTTHCPFKGDAAYRSVRVGDRIAQDAAWHYPEPIESAAWLRGYAALYWDRMDTWFDEDEQVFGHIRDPYHRVDVRASTRKVRVSAGEELLAESDRPLVLSETGLPNRFYLRRDDVAMDLLAPTDTSTICPYKGTASYYRHRGEPDVAWTYQRPLEDAVKITEHLCFDPAKVTVEVDGARVG